MAGGLWARVALYVAGLSAGLGFAALFSGGAYWHVAGAAIVGLLVGSAGAYRFVLLLPAAALYALLVVYGWPPLTPSGWRGLVREIGLDLYEAAGIMYANPVPYDPHPGIFAMLLPVVVLVTAFAASAAIFEESPVVSVAVLGLAIGILGTVSFEVGVALPFALFLASSVALLLASGAAAQPATSAGATPGGATPGGGISETGARAVPRVPSVPRGAWVLGAIVVGVALTIPAVPFAQALLRPAAIDWTRIGAGDTSRLAVEVDVGDYLTVGRDAELFRVRSEEGLYWRGGTLDRFDGAHWSSTVDEDAGYGEEINENVETHQVYQEFEVLQAETGLLFGGYEAIGTSVNNAVRRSDGSWQSPGTLREGSTYRVLSQVPQPTAVQLQTAGMAYPAEVRERFLQLPENRPEVLAETAGIIEANYDTDTPYETARAVERYLIYDGGFTYNLEADFTRTDRALEEFLAQDGAREGFCTQFATSMALILRELDVPSRVVYGAATGQPTGPGEYTVTGYNMHTWVEVYFPGVGWYPFDPTPGFTLPQAMQENAPRPQISRGSGGMDGAAPENPALRRQLENPSERTPQQQEQTPTNDPATGAPHERETPLWPVALLLPLAMAAVPLTKRLLASRGRTEDLYLDLSGRLVDASAPGGEAVRLAASPALTPTEKLLMLAGAVGLPEEPFRDFARAYSERLYARDPRANVLRSYRRALREYRGLPLWRRVLAALNPASLLGRGGRGVAARAGRLLKALRLTMRGLLRGFRR